MTDHPGVPYAQEEHDKSGCKQESHMGKRTVYRIVVRGELSERYAMAFEGMEMEAKSGRTILTGEIIDEPHLHGILDRIGSLGLRLLSVESFPTETSRQQVSDSQMSVREERKSLDS
jgi:hypothetical protein